MSDSKRDRYDGTPETMAVQFEPVAALEPDGKVMLAYPTQGTVKLSRLHIRQMKKCAAWVQAGKKLHAKLSFDKKRLKVMFKQVFKKICGVGK